MIESFSASALPGADRRLTHERVQLNLPEAEQHGVLVYWDGTLTAVLSRCPAASGAGSHLWVVELGFGGCEPPPSGQTFPTLGEALAWLEATCLADAA